MPPRGGLWPRRAAQNASCAVLVRSAAHTCTRQAAAGDRPLRLPEEPSPTRGAGKRNCGRAAARSGQNGWVACVCAAVLGDTELTSTPGPKGAEADPGRVGLCWPRCHALVLPGPGPVETTHSLRQSRCSRRRRSPYGLATAACRRFLTRDGRACSVSSMSLSLSVLVTSS